MTLFSYKRDRCKEKIVCDFFRFKQHLNRHKIYFQDSQSKNKLPSLMLDAYDAPILIQADQAAEQLDEGGE